MLLNIEHDVLDHVRFHPRMTILAAGQHLLHGTGRGIVYSIVTDLEGNQHSARLPALIVSGQGEYLFSQCQASKNGQSVVLRRSHV